MPTISTTRTVGSLGSRGHSHFLLRHELFGLVGPDSAALAPVGLGHIRRLEDELSSIALVDSCFYLRSVISDCLLIGFIRATETLKKELKKAIRDWN